MKKMIAALALALPALSACGGADDANQASADDINRLAISNGNLTTDVIPDAELAVPAETNMPAEPDHGAAAEPRPAEKSATPPRERASPPAKARPAPPPTDPHAGHDMSEMGNMANMSH